MQYSVPKSPENISAIASVSGDMNIIRRKSKQSYSIEERRKTSIFHVPAMNGDIISWIRVTSPFKI